MGRRYRVVTTVGCAVAALLVGLAMPAPLKLDGPLLDVLIWARATVGAPPQPETNPVAVVAVDQDYRAALEDYRQMRFDEAAAAWSKLDDGPAAVMAARARELLASPPPAPWDGVWNLTSK